MLNYICNVYKHFQFNNFSDSDLHLYSHSVPQDVLWNCEHYFRSSENISPQMIIQSSAQKGLKERINLET